jgi:hypothetical protein
VISAESPNTELAMAWRLAARGLFEEAVGALTDRIIEYQTGSIGNSVEAVSVAYILIRAGRLDLLDPWVRELLHSRAVAADAIVVVAEWFARAGCHVSAFNLLRELPNVGVFPMFSDGVSLAIARLTSYASMSTGFADETEHRRRTRDSLSQANLGGASSVSIQQLTVNAPTDPLASPLWLGQELTPQNVIEAGRVLQPFARRVGGIDWSSYLLRMSEPRSRALTRQVWTVRDLFATRLEGGWIPVSWRLLASPADRPVTKEFPNG